MRLRGLVFDDNELIRSFVQQIMEQRGYEVFSFSDPGLCPLYLQSSCHCPSGHACGDILISDVNMLMVGGLSFLGGQIKKGCKVKNMALMSGSWSASELELAGRIGCKTFHKPFAPDELRVWLAECEHKIAPCRRLSDWMGGEPSLLALAGGVAEDPPVRGK